MSVPAPNLYPDFNIVRLSHVEYRVTDLAAARAFYADTLGLQVSHEEPGRLYLRAMSSFQERAAIAYRDKTAGVQVSYAF